MASPRQIAASRANGALSRGPKTAAGKLRATGNRCRHGLDSKRLVMNSESQEDYDQLLATALHELQPATPAELALLHEFVFNHWLRRRVTIAGIAILNSYLPPIPYDAIDPDGPAAYAWTQALHDPAFCRALNAERRYANRMHRAIFALCRLKRQMRKYGHQNPPDAFFTSAQPLATKPFTPPPRLARCSAGLACMPRERAISPHSTRREPAQLPTMCPADVQVALAAHPVILKASEKTYICLVSH
jgi:hypothetical protein